MVLVKVPELLLGDLKVIATEGVYIVYPWGSYNGVGEDQILPSENIFSRYFGVKSVNCFLKKKTHIQKNTNLNIAFAQAAALSTVCVHPCCSVSRAAFVQ